MQTLLDCRCTCEQETTYLYVEKVRMCSSTCGGENEVGAIDTIDEKPVGLNMTFPVTTIVANKLMVSHCLWKRLPGAQTP